MDVERTIADAVGIIGIGAGLGFTFAPKLVSNIAGWKIDGAGRDILCRALGARDLMFGGVILATRNKADSSRSLWVKAFGVCIVADGVAALLALPEADNKPLTALIALQSFAMGGAAIWAGTQIQKP